MLDESDAAVRDDAGEEIELPGQVRPLDDAAFWARLRRLILPLRPSQYDVTSRCNLTCEGCLFFAGDEHGRHRNADDLGAVEAFFAAEAARGVRYGYFGGAEPSLAEAKLRAAARHIPYGVVFTNGTRRLTSDIPYRIHVSVWGRPDRSRDLRGADMLPKQVRNYARDPRAVFVFTVTALNIDDIPWVAAFCADRDLPLTFNHYSPTARYEAVLAGAVNADRFHTRAAAGDVAVLAPDDLRRARDVIDQLLADGTGRLLYTPAFNALVHDPAGLYPARDARGVALDCGVRLGGSLRHHTTDLAASAEKCCTPNVGCATCRLYAQSLATVLARETRALRGSRSMSRLLPLWRLWCALFLNDAALSAY